MVSNLMYPVIKTNGKENKIQNLNKWKNAQHEYSLLIDWLLMLTKSLFFNVRMIVSVFYMQPFKMSIYRHICVKKTNVFMVRDFIGVFFLLKKILVVVCSI